VGDFLGLRGEFDLIVGNPPYAVAEAHIRHALALSARYGSAVAFLLRVNFLGSKERFAFWRDHPPTLVSVLSERPSFFGTGTDASEYAFFVWRPPRGATELEVVSWKGANGK
jgi:hypothetical protein